MLKAKNKKLSLLIAIVFAFTVLVPAGAVFADDASISGNYKYAGTGVQDAGSISISEMAYADKVVVKIGLPDGVEFDSEPDENWADSDFSELSQPSDYIESDSDYYEVEFDASADENTVGDEFSDELKFAFTDNAGAALDIDDDFSGNLDVDVEVLGLEDGEHVWSETDSVTIAKVSGEEATVTADDAKKVSAGKGKEAAQISVEEPVADTISDAVYLEIETSGVTFNEVGVSDSRVTLDDTEGSNDPVEEDNMLSNVDDEIAWSNVSSSSGLPGKLKFTPYLNIDPDVTGDIEITVYGDDDEVEETTVTVATVGESELTVSADDDTGMEEYMRKAKIDELWELTLETDKEFAKGDTIYITLPDGFEFYEKAAEIYNISGDADYGGLYNDEQSMWLEVNGDGKDEIELSSIYVAALPDCEYGDINVEISGDIGEAEVQAGYVKPAVKVDAEQTQVATRGYNQPAGNITFVETDDDAIEDGMKLHLVLPHDIEFSSEPTVTVNGEEIDGAKVGPDEYDDDVLQIKVDNARQSKIDTLVISDIKYDIATSLLEGEVIKLELGGNNPKLGDNFNMLYESFAKFYDRGQGIYGAISHDEAWEDFQFYDEADDVIAEVPNAVVVDEDTVTASFTLGDEGVTVKNGRTLVQVNQLGDILDLQKSWDAENKIAYFVKSGTTVQFPIDENKIIINGNEMPVDQGGIIENDFTYATLRGIQMAFGGELDWDDETKTATFKFKK